MLDERRRRADSGAAAFADTALPDRATDPVRPRADPPDWTRELDYVSRGSSRVCFVHPRDARKCLKWTYDSQRGKTSTAQEEREYRRLSVVVGDDYDGLAKGYGIQVFHGTPMAVRELIRNETDGAIAGTVQSELNRSTYRADPARWDDALARFRGWLVRYRVLATDMTPGNLCVQHRKDGTLRLVLVDGLGHHDRFPVLDYLSAARALKLRTHLTKRGLLDAKVLLGRVEAVRRRRDRGHAGPPSP